VPPVETQTTPSRVPLPTTVGSMSGPNITSCGERAQSYPRHSQAAKPATDGDPAGAGEAAGAAAAVRFVAGSSSSSVSEEPTFVAPTHPKERRAACIRQLCDAHQHTLAKALLPPRSTGSIACIHSLIFLLLDDPRCRAPNTHAAVSRPYGSKGVSGRRSRGRCSCGELHPLADYH